MKLCAHCLSIDSKTTVSQTSFWVEKMEEESGKKTFPWGLQCCRRKVGVLFYSSEALSCDALK